MSTLFTSVIEDLINQEIEQSPDIKSFVNVRPSAKLSAMLEVLAHLQKKSASSILFEEIPKELGSFLLEQSNFQEIFLNTLKEMIDNKDAFLEPGSVLSKFEGIGAFKIKSPKRAGKIASFFHSKHAESVKPLNAEES